MPSSVCRRAHTTAELARSPLPGLGQTSRDFLSASREGDAQRAAKYRQQAKGPSTTRSARQRKVRQRAPIRPRGGGRHKGACEGGERDWDGVFCGCPCSPGPWATPRRSAAAPATKTRRWSAADCRRASPISACRGWRGGVNWAKLGEWGGLLGLWVTGLSGWGRAYHKEARPRRRCRST